MPQYGYSALDEKGLIVRGDVSATNDVEALDILARRGLTPVSISDKHSADHWWNREISLTGKPGVVSASNLERFFTTLAAMLKARFPLARALSFCQAQIQNPSFERALTATRTSLEGGSTLGEALRASGAIIPERFLALIDIGEASNQLEYVTQQAADILKSEATLRRDIRSALIYPIILLLMSVLVLGVVVFFLAPTLLPVFESAGSPPPVFLEFLANTGKFLTSSWVFVLGFTVIGLIGIFLFRDDLSKLASRIFLRLPITGKYLRQRETLKACQSLGLMLRSGASLPQALQAASDAVSLQPYEELLEAAEVQVVAGGSLSKGLQGNGLFDEAALTMIEAGEEVDDLKSVLETAVSFLAVETSNTLNQAIKILTPVLTLTIAICVGAIILTTISAIMDMNDIAF